MMQGSDLIEVRGLKLRGRIGVTADERSQDQPLVMSIAARLDTRAASTTDDLTATLDHAKDGSFIFDDTASTFAASKLAANSCRDFSLPG